MPDYSRKLRLSNQHGGSFQTEPLAFAHLRLGVVLQDPSDLHRKYRDDAGDTIIAIHILSVRVNAKTYGNGPAYDSRFLICLPEDGLGRRSVVHGPTLGGDPTLSPPAGDQERLNAVILHTIAERAKLCAHLALLHIAESDRPLFQSRHCRARHHHTESKPASFAASCRTPIDELPRRARQMQRFFSST